MGGWERGRSAEGVGADGQAGEPGVMQRVRAMQGDEIPYTGALYPVHRLDRVTSGLLVLGTSKLIQITVSRCVACGHIRLPHARVAPALLCRPYSQERGKQPPGVRGVQAAAGAQVRTPHWVVPSRAGHRMAGG